MIRSRPIRVVLAGMVVLAIPLVALAAWMRGAGARARFEHIASSALHRDITIEGMELGWSSLELEGLRVADPWVDDQAVYAEHASVDLDLWTLLGGGLRGTVRASAFEVTVRKRGHETNFHGMRSKSSGRELDLLLELEGGDVVYEDLDRNESVRAHRVALRGNVQRAGAQRVVGLDVEVGALNAWGIELRDVFAAARFDRESIVVPKLNVTLIQGAISAEGALAFGAEGEWSAVVDAHELTLDDDLLPIAAVVFPALAGMQDVPEGHAGGTMSLHVEAAGAGLSAESVRSSLSGEVQLGLRDLSLPSESLAVRLAGMFGQGDTLLAMPKVGVDARVEEGWIRVHELRMNGEKVALPFRGRAHMDGRLDLEIDVLPLLRAAGVSSKVERYAADLPLHVRGTVRDPDVDAPSARELAGSVGRAWLQKHRQAEG